MKIITTLLLLCLSSLVYSQTITSTSTGGNWNVTSSWTGGTVPTSTSDVVIADGATVTITSNQTCASMKVGQGSSGTLEFHNGSSVTLTVNGGLSVSSGAIFQAYSTPTANRTYTLSLSGNLVNNGNIAFASCRRVYRRQGMQRKKFSRLHLKFIFTLIRQKVLY